MRRHRFALLCVTLASSSVAACNYQMNWGDASGGCWSFSAPCDGGGTGMLPYMTEYLLGLDLSTVERSVVLPEGGHRAMLRVGDTATLHLVVTANGDVGHPTDTLRAVSWSATDSSSITIVPDDNGGVRLIGQTVGRAGKILANGRYPVMWACAAQTIGPVDCAYVTAIDIVAR